MEMDFERDMMQIKGAQRKNTIRNDNSCNSSLVGHSDGLKIWP